MKLLIETVSLLLLCIFSAVQGAADISARYAVHKSTLCSIKSSPKTRQRRSDAFSTRGRVPLAVVVPPVVRNLARGSMLKCLADLTGGLPLEVWKSSVVLEHIHSRETEDPPPSSLSILKSIINERGVLTLWSGLSPRMVEGIFSGGILLAAKEGLHTILSQYASPMLTKSVGVAIPSSVIGFLSGAGGGCAQALVMGPTSLVVTACVAASRENEGESVSALQVAQEVLQEKGIRGLYRGSSAVAMRQATNWASRQGFTEFVRPRIPIAGVAGELLAGCIGGTLSAWNTPFEVARIESQSKVMVKSGNGNQNEEKGKSLFGTMSEIIDERGAGALYVGLIPRAFQACYQTLFLVCVPRLLD